jgi:hypothetical protein
MVRQLVVAPINMVLLNDPYWSDTAREDDSITPMRNSTYNLGLSIAYPEIAISFVTTDDIKKYIQLSLILLFFVLMSILMVTKVVEAVLHPLSTLNQRMSDIVRSKNLSDM